MLMYFKTDFHEELFYRFLAKLNANDKDYVAFAYVASATLKVRIINALEDHRIKSDVLEELSNFWSSSEKTMLEAAWQLFSGRNFFYDGDEPIYTTIAILFRNLDNENSRIMLEAMKMRYSI